MTELLFMLKYTVLYMQYCCNSTVATAGVLNVRAKRLLPQRAPPCPPKSGKTVSHQPCPPNVPPQSLAKLFLTSRAPPQISKKLFFTDLRDTVVMVVMVSHAINKFRASRGHQNPARPIAHPPLGFKETLTIGWGDKNISWVYIRFMLEPGTLSLMFPRSPHGQWIFALQWF